MVILYSDWDLNLYHFSHKLITFIALKFHFHVLLLLLVVVVVITSMPSLGNTLITWSNLHNERQWRLGHGV